MLHNGQKMKFSIGCVLDWFLGMSDEQYMWAEMLFQK